MYITPFLKEKSALEEQLDNACTSGFRTQAIGGSQNFFSSLSCTKRAIPVIADNKLASVKGRGG